MMTNLQNAIMTSMLLLMLAAVQAYAFTTIKTPAKLDHNKVQQTNKNTVAGTSFLKRSSLNRKTPFSPLYQSIRSYISDATKPQIFATGYSTKTDLVDAIKDAMAMAFSAVPDDCKTIDLTMVQISSLYDAGATPTQLTVPIMLGVAQEYGRDLLHVIGNSVSACISSSVSMNSAASCSTVELESIPAVSVTLAVLPDTTITTFNVAAPDLPESPGKESDLTTWKRAVGLSAIQSAMDEGAKPEDIPPTSFFVLPSPAFSTDLDTLLQGLNMYFPSCQIAGGIASTVSSLSRAKLFQYSARGGETSASAFTDGCIGVAFQGDVQFQTLQAQGAKPVGGIYQILQGQESSIRLIQLDETATEALKEEEEEMEEEDEEDEEEEETPKDSRAAMAQFYAKAQIPKPPLAEANFLMRTLSDDDQAFMRRQLLIGLEELQAGSSPIASDLARLAAGQGHRFRVFIVASAGMKDGSVTLPLNSVKVQAGQRLRFFVREPAFARKEVEALWTGYKQRLLNEQFSKNDDKEGKPIFTPGACIIVPTLDRGSKFFQGKPGYESSTAARVLPTISCISGFYSNGVVGNVEYSSSDSSKTGVQGSASGYFLVGSWSGRPIYSAAAAAAEKAAANEEKAAQKAKADAIKAEEEQQKRLLKQRKPTEPAAEAPRSENGELILKRREIHSGRALTVSTVEWSVAEKTARPSSTLEGFMWDKETEVDRFRERVPLANLVSQCRLSMVDPKAPKPRDWVGPVKQAASGGKFVIIPEFKRMDPASGSLRKRYDLKKIARDFTSADVPALSVNCDAVLFGGSVDHITEVRKESSAAAIEKMTSEDDGIVVPPILASDLLLYPYQLYKLRLAGADAVNLLVAALETKDLIYLTKIAASVQMQMLGTISSEVQLDALTALPAGSVNGIIVSNRELADFSFDMSGEQALKILKSKSMKKFKAKHGEDILVLVEGRVGMIERKDDEGNMSALQYIKELKEAGATGAISGGGLAAAGSDSSNFLRSLQKI